MKPRVSGTTSEPVSRGRGVVEPLRWDALPIASPSLPWMRHVEQRFQVPPAIDVSVEIRRQWESIASSLTVSPGSAIAVGVGSRGISGLTEAVRSVVECLNEAGAKPFITPAMGSHGGGTAQGQVAVLAARGVTEKTVGAPVRAGTDVVNLGEIDGIPLVLDRLAHDADGFVLVNRVKPHTDFVGRFESGLMKMLVIGLGNQVGADLYHRHALNASLADIIANAGKSLLERTSALFGVAIVENQEHLPSRVSLLPASAWESEEPPLLEQARVLLPRLPLDDIDLLIVDEMGKNVSGAGIDPNVTGRSLGVWGVHRSSPRITRIVVRDLTEESEGNACGLGMVDITCRRLFEKIDFAATSVNALTSCMPESAKIPPLFATDREAIVAALTTIRPVTAKDVRIVHIKNTLELEHIEVSEGCLQLLENGADVSICPERLELRFDDDGTLMSTL
jgi:hypothetical protein